MALPAAGALAALLVSAGAVHANAAETEEFVKYYAVTQSYSGKPENLGEIAQRFLDDTGRATEIFNLNTGRKQPDGGALTDRNQLHPGWLLILPWDAVGAEVQYGVLPTTAPAPPSKSGTVRTSPQPGASGSHLPPKPGGPCSVAGAGSSGGTDWAALRLGSDQAWTRTKGGGQLVAVLDSGTDASLPQLSAHVAQGADIVSSSGWGDTDCLGSGTGMASIIVAQPVEGSSLTGIAPDATVLPVRVVADNPVARPADGATAIEVAVSAGAKVIALGLYVDINDTAVAHAIAEAASRDVVVVAPAPTATVAANPSAVQTSAALLRVGAVGVDNQTAAQYRPGSVDVVAPGMNVTTLGVTGTGVLTSSGTQYAVAFAAGQVALVRAAFPDLSAAQVVHRIEATTDRLGDAQPDSQYGWGMINPASSVSKELPEEQHQVAPKGAAGRSGATPTDGRLVALLAISIVVMAAAGMMIVRIRRLVRMGPAEEQEPDHEPAAVVPSGAPPRPAEAMVGLQREMERESGAAPSAARPE